MLLRTPRSRQEIDKEGQHIEGEDESDDPFEDRCNVLPAIERASCEDDGEYDLDDDEDQLHPEGQPEDGVFAEMNPQALVLGADEDGADDIAGDEQEEETVVQVRVVKGIEDREEDQTAGSCYGEDDFCEYQC